MQPVQAPQRTDPRSFAVRAVIMLFQLVVPMGVAAVSALLAHYYPARRVPRAALARHARLFMGYSNQLQVVHPYSGTLTPTLAQPDAVGVEALAERALAERGVAQRLPED